MPSLLSKTSFYSKTVKIRRYIQKKYNVWATVWIVTSWTWLYSCSSSLFREKYTTISFLKCSWFKWVLFQILIPATTRFLTAGKKIIVWNCHTELRRSEKIDFFTSIVYGFDHASCWVELIRLAKTGSLYYSPSSLLLLMFSSGSSTQSQQSQGKATTPSTPEQFEVQTCPI
jgi:hypothetical protein